MQDGGGWKARAGTSTAGFGGRLVHVSALPPTARGWQCLAFSLGFGGKVTDDSSLLPQPWLSTGVRYFFFFLATPQGLWDLSSQLEIEVVPLAVKAWSPTQWITKEDPSVHFLNQNLR